MAFEEKVLSEAEVSELFEIEENYFNDFKAKDIKAGKLSKTISAFCNASGGEIYLGIREESDTKIKHWEGFVSIEEANSFNQCLYNLEGLNEDYNVEFLKHPTLETYVMHITLFKTPRIVKTSDGYIYVRKGAQNLPIDNEEKKKRLELDKGISSYEDQTVSNSSSEDVTDSKVFQRYFEHNIPQAEPVAWLKKQRLLHNELLTVAGELLFSDEPQICLPKRSSIKVYRYQTSDTADRDTLADNPITIEGSAYYQIYQSVSKVKEIIETIKKLGKGFESIEYPEETLHEIITNAVLHRDYSIPTDIQIRIFDNRVEVESPGKLPGYVTVNNILDSQSARNPKIVRLINKFPDAPNKDVGEGLNTAFAAMEKLRLKNPEIKELEKSVLVIIRHEKLASPEELVIEYLRSHDNIKNSEGRTFTGIKSENKMKRVFYALRDRGYISMVENKKIWKKTENFDKLVSQNKPID